MSGSPPIPHLPDEGNYGNLDAAIDEHLYDAVEYAVVVPQLIALDQLGQGYDPIAGKFESLDRIRAAFNLGRVFEGIVSGFQDPTKLVEYRGNTFYYADPDAASALVEEARSEAAGLDVYTHKWRWLNRIPLADTWAYVEGVRQMNTKSVHGLLPELGSDAAVGMLTNSTSEDNWNEEAARAYRSGVPMSAIVTRTGNPAAYAQEVAEGYHYTLKAGRQAVYDLLRATIRALYEGAHGETGLTAVFDSITSLVGNLVGAGPDVGSADDILSAAGEVAANVAQTAHEFNSSEAEAILGETKPLLEQIISDTETQFDLIREGVEDVLSTYDEMKLSEQAIPASSEIF